MWDPNVGRFWTMDAFPGNNSDPLSLHRYLYAHANPVNNVDASGNWPTRVKHVHQAAIDDELLFLPDHDREILKAQQVFIDGDAFQTSYYSFVHAMSSPVHTVDRARNKANQWIREELTLARQLERAGKHDEALMHLGNAMHTLQDATSPSHNGFQFWDGSWGKTSKEARAHVAKEFYDPGPGSELYAATRNAYFYFVWKGPLPYEFIKKDPERIIIDLSPFRNSGFNFGAPDLGPVPVVVY
jgi:hypothetical protein